MEKKSSILGVLSLFAGIAIFSTLEIASKELRDVTTAIPSYFLVMLRFVGTGIVLGSIGYVDFRRSGKRLVYSDWISFAINGIVGVALGIWLFHAGVDTFANASSAAVVFSANALYAVILARFINGEMWTLRKWLAVVVGLAGVSLFVFETGVPDMAAMKAIGIMSLSSLTFAFSVCYTKRVVSRYGAMFFMGMSSIIGSLAILPFAIIDLQPDTLPACTQAWPQLLYIVLVGTLLSYLLYYYGLKSVSVFIASMSFLLKPVLACIFAVLWRHDHMNFWTICGTVVIVASICIAAISAHGKPHQSANITEK